VPIFLVSVCTSLRRLGAIKAVNTDEAEGGGGEPNVLVKHCPIWS